MDKFPLILTFLSEKVQLSGWNCSPFWDDDTDIEASFSKSFQTLLGISGLSSICCVTSSNKSYQLFLVDVLRMEFLIIFLEESPFLCPATKSGGVLCYTLRTFECLSVRLSVRPSAVEHWCPVHNFDTVRDNVTKLGTNINHDQTTCRD